MQTLDDPKVRILTYRQGLLAAVGHDLRLKVGDVRIQTDGQRVVAVLGADSVRVEGAMRAGRLDPDALSEPDRREIERTIAHRILRSDAFSEIRFEGVASPRDGGYRLQGRVQLLGRSRSVVLEVQPILGRLRGQVELQPSQWGIRPFKAWMGAIKLHDRVTVDVDVPAPAEPTASINP